MPDLAGFQQPLHFIDRRRRGDAKRLIEDDPAIDAVALLFRHLDIHRVQESQHDNEQSDAQIEPELTLALF